MENKYNDAERYLTLIHESDQAFGWFIRELSQSNENYIVMMFGDHQVSVGEDQSFIESLCGKAIDSMTEQEREALYTIPYIIWANYDIEEHIVTERTSINYLRLILLDLLGVDGSAYDVFLRKCRDEYPAVNALGYFDSDNVFYSASELDLSDMSQILSRYWTLQYCNMFESENLYNEFYEVKVDAE